MNIENLRKQAFDLEKNDGSPSLGVLRQLEK